MALKKLITKEEHAKLSAELQKEYIADGDGFKIDVEGGFEDAAALKRAKDHEKEQRKAAELKSKELQDQITTLTEERDGLLKGAIPKADVEKLENSYKGKLAAREKELNTQIETANASLQTLLVDNVAQSLASELSTAPAVIMPHIKSRLRAEKNTEGKFETKIVDTDGKPSALSIDDLKKEFIANTAFAPILTGSKGSGGGAAGPGGGGATGSKGKVDWSKPMNPKAQVAAMKAANVVPAATE